MSGLLPPASLSSGTSDNVLSVLRVAAYSGGSIFVCVAAESVAACAMPVHAARAGSSIGDTSTGHP
eukprot:390889-Rhodomonas_salina.4